MPLGEGSDRVPVTAAIRLTMAEFAVMTLSQGSQEIAITARGKAFHHRTVR